MTCIVGLAHGGKTYIGGDRAGIAGYSLNVRSDKKVFEVGQFTIGVCGSFRIRDVLKYKFEPPKFKPSIHDPATFMVTTFLDAARKAFGTAGCLITTHGEEELAGDSSFIVGFRGKLFTIESDLQVAGQDAPYHAVGCGADPALGALYASAGSKMPPRARVIKALEASEYFNAGVRGPFDVITT